MGRFARLGRTIRLVLGFGLGASIFWLGLDVTAWAGTTLLQGPLSASVGMVENQSEPDFNVSAVKETGLMLPLAAAEPAASGEQESTGVVAILELAMKFTAEVNELTEKSESAKEEVAERPTALETESDEEEKENLAEEGLAEEAGEKALDVESLDQEALEAEPSFPSLGEPIPQQDAVKEESETSSADSQADEQQDDTPALSAPENGSTEETSEADDASDEPATEEAEETTTTEKAAEEAAIDTDDIEQEQVDPQQKEEKQSVEVNDDLAVENKEEAQQPPQTDLKAGQQAGEQAGEEEGVVEIEEEKVEPIGHRLAAGIVELLNQEIQDGLSRRHATAAFSRLRSYAGHKLDVTARGSHSEITGNCRLRWYDWLLRHPMESPTQAETFTRDLHGLILSRSEGILPTLQLAAHKLDLKVNKSTLWDERPQTAEAVLERLEVALVEAKVRHAAALARLRPSEVRELKSSAYKKLTRNGDVGHTLTDRSRGRRICDLLEKKVDRAEMIMAAEALVPLADPEILELLAQLPTDETIEVKGVEGTVVRRVTTEAGDILIGGPEANTYQLDTLKDVIAVIDLGGNDTFYEGTCNLDRPVFVLVDLDGDDFYRGSQPGIQGGSILGVSLLIDRAGSDAYEAKDLAQGSTIGGVGILIDKDSNDAYVGVRRVQGQAIAGVGLLLNYAGDDKYRAAMWAQGFGGPLGFGLLDDLDGEDHYFAGGLYLDSYEDTPGHEGWSQGIGAGIRQVSNGGIGVILDGGGDDVYEFDYMGHGGGYWLGLGFARDFGGNDQRLGATRERFNGARRTEGRFQRFGCGFGCHFALGFLFDDHGDDTYNGTIMGQGFAWDVATGVLCDLEGNDSYSARGTTTKGAAGQAGMGILYDFSGNDRCKGRGQGYASSNISYHDMPACGGNFSFLIDYGGTDEYDCRARNNTYLSRGSSTGFLIDRPKEEELEARKQAKEKR